METLLTSPTTLSYLRDRLAGCPCYYRRALFATVPSDSYNVHSAIRGFVFAGGEGHP